MIENINTVYENLPFKVNGFTIYDAADDYYTIVLNSRKSSFINEKTYKHELNHITNGDFVTVKNVDMLETALH